MNGLGQKVATGAKKTAQQTAQAVAQQVRDETLETARAARQQVIPTETAPAPGSYDRQQYVSQMAQNTQATGYNPDAHNAEAAAKLTQLRNRLAQFQQEEMQRVQQKNLEAQQAWQQAQDEKMKLMDRQRPEGPVSPLGKAKKAMGGAMRGMKAKLSTIQKGGEARAARSKD